MILSAKQLGFRPGQGNRRDNSSASAWRQCVGYISRLALCELLRGSFRTTWQRDGNSTIEVSSFRIGVPKAFAGVAANTRAATNRGVDNDTLKCSLVGREASQTNFRYEVLISLPVRKPRERANDFSPFFPIVACATILAPFSRSADKGKLTSKMVRLSRR